MKFQTTIIILLLVIIGGALYIKQQKPKEIVKSPQPYPEYLVEGGKKQDQIPSINKPSFVDVKQAEEWLDDEAEGISVRMGSVVRFYPLQILVRHEIVNDTIDHKRILVTYSPLSDSVGVFDPAIKGRQVEFGVTGRVWHSISVYYDRYTKSLWEPVRGSSFLGEEKGERLARYSAERVVFKNWKRTYPHGEVLSRYTGKLFGYDKNPYEEYFKSEQVGFPYSPHDTRLKPKEYVFGLVVEGKAKAYAFKGMSGQNIIDSNGGIPILIRYNKKLQTYEFFSGENKIPVYQGYWFAWAAMYPKTEVYPSSI